MSACPRRLLALLRGSRSRPTGAEHKPLSWLGIHPIGTEVNIFAAPAVVAFYERTPQLLARTLAQPHPPARWASDCALAQKIGPDRKDSNGILAGSTDERRHEI